MSEIRCATPEELLGSLNEVERRNAPPRLWYAGDPALLRGRRISVVGTRQASPEGLRRAARLVRELVHSDVTIVSGLALGVDAVAHATAVESGGRTIAVLGNGLDVVSPRANAELQRVIARDHLVVSQFEPGSPPLDRNFPQRNRTMALLSDATIIVEAKERSGTVSQGWEAIRLGRPVYLLRSLADSGLAWTKLLVDYGAEILNSTDQVLEHLPAPSELAYAAAAF